ncbi:hypothetical protein JEHA107958_06670 [Jeotgalicoccus halotolerans]
MNLTSITRRNYFNGTIAIEDLRNLSKLLNGPDIYKKRDEQLGLAGGGNKKIGILIADALKNDADTLIT